MYSTRRPNVWTDPALRKQHPPPGSRNPRQAAEALFRTRHETPPAPSDMPTPMEIKRSLHLPQRPSAELTLTPKQRKQMRTLYLYGMTARELAEHFGVSLKTIDRALGTFTRKRG
jgi:DNA-directed RNA polymerase specialized sigma24 family protein